MRQTAHAASRRSALGISRQPPYSRHMSETIWFATDGETATRHTTQALTRHGFRVFRSFDFHPASAQRPGDNPSACQCPHHGTEQCTCQYVVLLVYGPSYAPAVITIHSCELRTEVQLIEDANSPQEAGAVEPITLAVVEAALASQAWVRAHDQA
jgi:hypothetical protein